MVCRDDHEALSRLPTARIVDKWRTAAEIRSMTSRSAAGTRIVINPLDTNGTSNRRPVASLG